MCTPNIRFGESRMCMCVSLRMCVCVSISIRKWPFFVSNSPLVLFAEHCWYDWICGACVFMWSIVWRPRYHRINCWFRCCCCCYCCCRFSPNWTISKSQTNCLLTAQNDQHWKHGSGFPIVNDDNANNVQFRCW